MTGPLPAARAVAAHAVADACPGALRPHQAADGLLVRLRLAGGAVSGSSLAALAAAAESFGDGRLGLTSRGNLQIRAVSDVDALAGAVRAAGLLPSLTHERVRNIIVSPLGGRTASSRGPIDGLVGDLDVALCLRPALADLPGRFLFAVDDGTGDVADLGADVVLQALGSGSVAVSVGAGRCLVVPSVHAVAVALAMAEAFLELRAESGSPAWRIAELPDGPAAVLAQVATAFADQNDENVVIEPDLALDHNGNAVLVPQPGLIEQGDGRLAVCALVPLGVLDAEAAQAVSAAAALSSAEPDAALRVTPWRRVVIRDLEVPAALAARELLGAYGLIVDGGTAWNRVTACAGQPGCARALADVHADALAFLPVATSGGVPVHWAGCARGCGTPVGPVAVAVATGHGYDLHDAAQLSPAERDWIGER